MPFRGRSVQTAGENGFKKAYVGSLTGLQSSAVMILASYSMDHHTETMNMRCEAKWRTIVNVISVD